MYTSIVGEKAAEFVPDAEHAVGNSPAGKDSIVRAILAGTFARSSGQPMHATLSVNDWPTASGIATRDMTFSLMGPRSGEYEIFYTLAPLPPTPDAPVQVAPPNKSPGWAFLPANSPRLTVSAGMNPKEGGFDPNGLATTTTRLPDKAVVSQDQVVSFQAKVKLGTDELWTNVVQVRIR